MAVVLVACAVTLFVLGMQSALYGWFADVYMSKSAVIGNVSSVVDGTDRSSVFRAQNKLKPLPVVLMHGMGDAAGNSGMKHIRNMIAKELNTYAVNIQIGNSVEEDVKNSYFINMDDQLTIFAQEVRKDPQLKNGFNAAGFSQGNLLLRAYIEKFNDPPVFNFVSFHGPLAGVGALPECKPTEFICKEVNKLIGIAAYTETLQREWWDSLDNPYIFINPSCIEHLAQSNYYRDPLKISEYLEHARFLPDINNERHPVNVTYKDNFIKLHNLVLVRAKHDTEVFPNYSEWFGAYRDGSRYNEILHFNETRWYQEDLFGLKTLDKAGKVHFLETDGNHLQFSNEFLINVVNQYFSSSSLTTLQ